MMVAPGTSVPGRAWTCRRRGLGVWVLAANDNNQPGQILSYVMPSG
jgi:hypothetical protein